MLASVEGRPGSETGDRTVGLNLSSRSSSVSGDREKSRERGRTSTELAHRGRLDFLRDQDVGVDGCRTEDTPETSLETRHPRRGPWTSG